MYSNHIHKQRILNQTCCAKYPKLFDMGLLNMTVLTTTFKSLVIFFLTKQNSK